MITHSKVLVFTRTFFRSIKNICRVIQIKYYSFAITYLIEEKRGGENGEKRKSTGKCFGQGCF